MDRAVSIALFQRLDDRDCTSRFPNCRKLKLYEEQELTMQVFSEPDSGLGDERRGSGVSVGMGDTSQDNTYATIQHPLPANRHRPTTPDYTTLPGNHNVRRAYFTSITLVAFGGKSCIAVVNFPSLVGVCL